MGDMAFDMIERKAPGALSREFLGDLFADHYPLQREPATPQESIMVIGGTGDHLVPQTQISQLQSRWPRAKVVWVGGGHAAATNRTEAFDRIARFFMS
jgi:surfactin synthase thioesterase subunit